MSNKDNFSIKDYNHRQNGPLLGVSDEGSAKNAIKDAIENSAKYLASDNTSPWITGLIIDAERMTSGGEAPVGPEELDKIVFNSKSLLSTNVGVRTNTRLYQPNAEFKLSESTKIDDLVAEIVNKFKPFVNTPNRIPRPLAAYVVFNELPEATLEKFFLELNKARTAGTIGGQDVHRIILLLEFPNEIGSKEVSKIEHYISFLSELEVTELGLDADLIMTTRRRINVQGILNVLSPEVARKLMQFAQTKNVKLSYRYSIDTESSKRTIWSGLYAMKNYGLHGAKYGLVPLLFEQQMDVIKDVQNWADSWTAIPAFYVDVPLLTASELYLSGNCYDALKLWLTEIAKTQTSVVLVDCPDRIFPRLDLPENSGPKRLVKNSDDSNDRGVLRMSEIEDLIEFGNTLGIKILWSGGIGPVQAYQLGKLGAFGIFTTSSTSKLISVGDGLRKDPSLAVEKEPTTYGVMRIHALLQAGFLYSELGSDNTVKSKIEQHAKAIIGSPMDSSLYPIVNELNVYMKTLWRNYWSSKQIQKN